MVIEVTEATRSASDAGPHRGKHRTPSPIRKWLMFARLDDRPSATVFVLLLWQTAALVMQVYAVYIARIDGNAGNAFAQVVSTCSVALAFASALWVLTRPRLARSVRNAA